MNLLVHLLRKLNIVPVPLVDTQSQLARARAVLEANRLGLFHALAESASGLTPEEIAERLGLSPRGVGILLTALAATGYLRVGGGRYRNGPWVTRWIVDPKRGFSNYLKLQLNVWSRLEHLGDCVVAGSLPGDAFAETMSVSSEEQQIYTQAMRELAGLLLPEFIKRVKLHKDAQRLLDIGGAHGDYCRALVRRFPGLKATVLDLAGPIATANKVLEEEGNPDGIQLQVGDALKDDLGSGWDVVLLANMVHGFSPEQNRTLFGRIRAALAPGGTLLILDQFTGLGRFRDVMPALISVNLFTIGGGCYRLAEVKQLLEHAGFQSLRVKPFVAWRASCLLEARTK